MEIRFKVNDSFMGDLKKTLGLKNAAEVTHEALLLLTWAVKEVKQNREIVSGIVKKGKNKKIEIQPKEIYPGSWYK